MAGLRAGRGRRAEAALAGWQILYMILICGFFCLVVVIGRSWSGRADWGRRQTLAVITGALLPAILMSLVLPAALRALEPFATLPMLALLIWLARRYQPAPLGSSGRCRFRVSGGAEPSC